jgi:tetratricopeptide (TPR) repeat protein
MEKEIKASKALREYFQKGVNALEKKNYDYAIEMLLQVVQEEPSYSEARHELHRAEYEKYSHQPPSLVALILIKVNNLIPLIMAYYYESVKKFEKAIAFYEDLLRYDLCNQRYLNKIYSLALKAEYPDIAIIALESMYRLNKNKSEIAQNLGRLYRDKGDIQKATFFFKRAIEIDPHNQKLTKAFKDLEALHTIHSGGWDKKDSYRSKLKDEETTQSLEKTNRLIDSTGVSEAELSKREAALAKNPELLPTWLELIDFCLESGLLKKAHEKIAQAQKNFPNTDELKERVNAYNQ